ncbi:hypothetical protein ABZX40_16520 [Streptomyces sp. NPDC004610]|uniref:hypothetical protein n=1 Tax=unclassified Streptomyces TaxID=2593676 RepID=UPI0033B9A813
MPKLSDPIEVELGAEPTTAQHRSRLGHIVKAAPNWIMAIAALVGSGAAIITALR